MSITPHGALIQTGLQAAQNKTVWQGLGATQAEGLSLAKKVILIPVIIVCIILIIAALIAVGNGAYTIGTLITFSLGVGGLVAAYWVTRPDYTAAQYFAQTMHENPQLTHQIQQSNYNNSIPNSPKYSNKSNIPLVNSPTQYTNKSKFSKRGTAEGEGTEHVSNLID